MNRTLHAVLETSDTEGTDRMVLVVLAACADWQGRVAISNRKIADFTAMGKSNASKIVNRLIDVGALRVITEGGGRDHPAMYEVVRGDLGWTEPEQNMSAQVDKIDSEPPPPEDYTWKTMVGVVDVDEDGTASARRGTDRDDSWLAAIDFATAPPCPTPALEVVGQQFIPQCFPQDDVGRLLTAAGVATAPDDAPLLWFRAEHSGSVAPTVEALGCQSVNEAVALLQGVRAAKGSAMDLPRKLSDLVRWAQ